MIKKSLWQESSVFMAVNFLQTSVLETNLGIDPPAGGCTNFQFQNKCSQHFIANETQY
jgi:hypothetical protein